MRIENICCRYILLGLLLIINAIASGENLKIEINQKSQQNEISTLKEEIARLSKLVASLSERLKKLEESAEIERELSNLALPSQPTTHSVTRTGSNLALQNQNPDISVVGMVSVKTSGDKRDPERNNIKLNGSEITLSRNVSPYARANLTLGYHENEGHVEECYADFAHILPGRWEARIGKFLVPIGILNQIHPHDWPVVSRPISLEYFFGNEHGYSEEGISFSTPIDLQSKTYCKFQADILRGSSPIIFNKGQTRVFGSRISGNTPLNERDDINWGISCHQGAWNRLGDLDSTLYSGDLMWRRRYSQFNRLTLWGEWLWNKREGFNRPSVTAQGYYLAGMYKFRKDRDWHVGMEYDCSERPGDSRYNTIAQSIFAGYWFTENDRLQLQFRKIRDPFLGRSNNEILLQVIWGMGPHKPHLANF